MIMIMIIIVVMIIVKSIVMSVICHQSIVTIVMIMEPSWSLDLEQDNI